MDHRKHVLLTLSCPIPQKSAPQPDFDTAAETNTYEL